MVRMLRVYVKDQLNLLQIGVDFLPVSGTMLNVTLKSAFHHVRFALGLRIWRVYFEEFIK